MALRVFEDLEFGGVDARSNPLNEPRNRSLRCFNWVPKQAGYLELRYGYSTVTMSTVSASTIHTIIPYQLWDGTRYALFGQGTAWKQIAAGTVTSPTVRGTAFSSSGRAGWYAANNRVHIGNGTDQKWYDGTNWRDNGLRALTAAEVVNVIVSDGVRELTSAEASTITLTQAAGGSFAASTLTGHLFYVAIFDKSTNERGPATINVASGRRTVTLNQKVTVAVMPDLSTVNTNWVKLIAGTVDDGTNAYFWTNTSTAITSCTRSGTTLTVISTLHGLTAGASVVVLSGTTNFDGVYAVVTSTDVNTFTVILPSATGANTTGGTVKQVVQAGNAVTTIDVLAPTQDTSILANASRGIAAVASGLSNSGYQFYGSIYNSTSGHVGNRLALGGRWAPATRCNVHFSGLPVLSSTDSEWSLLIGRTGDGAQLSYALMDSAGNWVTGTASTKTVTEADIDGNSELPTRNGVINSACTMFARVGDRIYAADPASPTIRRSASELDDRQGIFVGRPEQSWADNDIETFPTSEQTTGIAEVDYELFVGTQNNCGILTDLSGFLTWRGPWNVGLAGSRATVKTHRGFFWLSGDKELCTFLDGLPTPISDEYEAAELSQLGSAYLSTVELVYFRDKQTAKDEIRIEGRKSDGTPYTVIHDFKLRDERSPFGQGYGSQFQGALGTTFTISQVRDSNGKLQLWAGASTGQLYQLYADSNDAGTDFTGDFIMLVNAGTERISVPFFDWYGDGNVVMSVGKTLKTSTSTNAQFSFEDLTTASSGQSVPGYENDYLWRAYLTSPEMLRTYLRFQLTTHAADGNLALNAPPHVPLEWYGRIYEIIPAAGAERGR